MFSKVSVLTAKSAVIVLALSLQGCPSMSVWNFKAAENTGASKGYVKLMVYSPGGADPFDNDVYSAYPELKKALTFCRSPAQQGMFPIIAPVIGKFLFDLYVDAQSRKLEALETAATKSYAAQMTMHADTLAAAVGRQSCVVLTRVSDKEKLEFVSVLRLEPSPSSRDSYADEAFKFKAIYVAAHSSAAITRDAAPPEISVSFAITVSGIGTQQNGLPAFAPMGDASVTVPHLPIVNPIQQKSCAPDKCPASGPIPLDKRTALNAKWRSQSPAAGTSIVPRDNIMLNDSGTLLVGVAVVENGDIGVPVDAAKSELAAIKAAFGPLVSDIVKEKYK
ncbi:hypothetical protein [Pseudomonas sp. GZD-222]|uniref:hypothetical protein n=1 Tax=Pseudomonas sp. GZD-222 TaxID=3404805 RepID=UPI003BB5F500